MVFMAVSPDVGYKKAIEHLRKCSSEHGFFASLEKQANYRRIYPKDIPRVRDFMVLP